MSEKSFAGQVAIVTGAGKGTGGVGQAIALRLAQGGAKVMVADVDPKAAETAAEVNAATGSDTLHYTGSLAEENNVKALVGATLLEIGRAHV